MKKSKMHHYCHVSCFWAFLFAAFTLMAFSTFALGSEWHVAKTGGDFTTIQSAIDAATTVDGDTIWVADGIYQENVNVFKSIIICSEHGYSSTMVEAANPMWPVFTITANYVIIKGFTVYGTTGDPTTWNNSGDAGILLYNGTQYCTISNNRCGYDNAHRNYVGISVNHSGPHNISNNICNSNTYGIWLNNSNNGIVLNNSCSHNVEDGIHLSETNNMTVIGNTCDSNMRSGIMLSCDKCAILSNICSENLIGIWVNGNKNTIYLNNMKSNGENIIVSTNNNTLHSLNKIHYIYMSSLHINYLGNYYSNHVEIDSNKDGITDTPYVNNVYPDVHDEYPLVTTSDKYSIVVLPYLDGDFDRDGDVDGSDLEAFSKNFGKYY